MVNRESPGELRRNPTNGPIGCEEFLPGFLERGFKIKGNSHEGVALPKVDSD